MPLEIIKGKRPRPRRVLLYGPAGIGKSTWASKAPDPLFCDLEGGTGDLDVMRTPVLDSWNAVGRTLATLLAEGGEYKTLVLDSIDWAERLLHRQICKDNAVEETMLNKVGGGYGVGFIQAAARAQNLLELLAKIQSKWGWTIVLLGHAASTNTPDPQAASYLQWQPDLDKRFAACVREWCDEVFFAYQETIFEEVDAKVKSESRVIAKTSGRRKIKAVGGPAVMAKNRLGITTDLPLEWAAYQRLWPGGGGLPAPPVAEERKEEQPTNPGETEEKAF